MEYFCLLQLVLWDQGLIQVALLNHFSFGDSSQRQGDLHVGCQSYTPCPGSGPGPRWLERPWPKEQGSTWGCFSRALLESRSWTFCSFWTYILLGLHSIFKSRNFYMKNPDFWPFLKTGWSDDPCPHPWSDYGWSWFVTVPTQHMTLVTHLYFPPGLAPCSGELLQETALSCCPWAQSLPPGGFSMKGGSLYLAGENGPISEGGRSEKQRRCA